jgi:hypothetical protein
VLYAQPSYPAWQAHTAGLKLCLHVVSPAGAAAFRSDSPVDDNEDDGQLQQPSNGPSTGAEAEAALAALSKLPATPRLRTRLFAAELLLSVFAAVGPDSRHRHPRPKYEDTAGAQGVPESGGRGSQAVTGADASCSVQKLASELMCHQARQLHQLHSSICCSRSQQVSCTVERLGHACFFGPPASYLALFSVEMHVKGCAEMECCCCCRW